MNLFFISDNHYFHKNIIKYCNRPFSSVEEMNEELIKRNNSVVKTNDLCYYLGDFGFTSKENIIKICNRLNGRKIIIFGNHDNRKAITNSGCFERIFTYFDFKYDDNFICLFHYPISEWNKKFHGSIHLHGHCHGNLKEIIPNRIDVGVDSHNFYPWSWEEIKEKVK